MTDNKIRAAAASQGVLPLPNPDSWTDTGGAAEMLNRNRTTIYDYVDRGVLRQYKIGKFRVYWVPEVLELADALNRLSRR